MNKTNEKTLNKALKLIQNNQFGREWNNLFENTTELERIIKWVQ